MARAKYMNMNWQRFALLSLVILPFQAMSDWETATPESQEVDAAVLDALHEELASGELGNIDGMAVIRNGYLVYERNYEVDYDTQFAGLAYSSGMYQYHDSNWHPWYDHGTLHTIQSISKGVTSALIGIAIGRGEIPSTDVAIMPYFEGYEPAVQDPRRDAVTLRHLLMMTAGIDWDESTAAYTDAANSAAAMEAADEWVQFVLDQPMRAAPGEEFEYNSGITMLLSHMLVKATGKQADVYATEHLFGPLGIDEFYWKKTPTGLVDTEGGLYLKPLDLAKIGQLYLQGGVWDGERLLPEGWVDQTMTDTVAVPDWVARYGYQWWLLPYEGGSEQWAYTGLGYGGQRVLVVPEYGLVAVFTGWNIDDIPALDAVMALERVLQAVR
jgi:CubicO group peptidase (beta-lactamase class C family)